MELNCLTLCLSEQIFHKRKCRRKRNDERRFLTCPPALEQLSLFSEWDCRKFWRFSSFRREEITFGIEAVTVTAKKGPDGREEPAGLAQSQRASVNVL